MAHLTFFSSLEHVSKLDDDVSDIALVQWEYFRWKQRDFSCVEALSASFYHQLRFFFLRFYLSSVFFAITGLAMEKVIKKEKRWGDHDRPPVASGIAELVLIAFSVSKLAKFFRYLRKRWYENSLENCAIYYFSFTLFPLRGNIFHSWPQKNA